MRISVKNTESHSATTLPKFELKFISIFHMKGRKCTLCCKPDIIVKKGLGNEYSTSLLNLF